MRIRRPGSSRQSSRRPREDLEFLAARGVEVWRAIDRGRFEVDLHPIRELESGAIEGYEVLLRMIGEDGETVPPSVFLAIAEELGLMHEVDRWVVEHALHLLASSESCPRLHVNLSPVTVTEPTFAAEILKSMDELRVDPARLGFEITEEATIGDVERATLFMLRLSARGCRFALDDFGTGYASLSLLRDLPVDTMKIDGCFIRGLAESPVDQRMLPAMVAMARALGLTTVAEWVLDGATADLLRSFGVDYAQGDWAGERFAATKLARGAAALRRAG